MTLPVRQSLVPLTVSPRLPTAKDTPIWRLALFTAGPRAEVVLPSLVNALFKDVLLRKRAQPTPSHCLCNQPFI